MGHRRFLGLRPLLCLHYAIMENNSFVERVEAVCDAKGNGCGQTRQGD